ncbi:hypothetical protein Taro_005213 [Colocasia esculenta]|uniref:Uncharacterized protein n=1 Tax=Colocasia esculenta TaxID=4460 RepID=A0A843TSD0_COLES|nr:hypothetical protein [Colocasia esculenta]
MASHGRRGVPARGGEQRREERVEPRREDQGEQQAPAPQGPVLPPPPPVDYGVFMQGLVQAMQTQAHTQAALQAQLEAQQAQAQKFVMGLRPSLRMRLVAFDHRNLDEALSAACRQEGEMELYLEEKKASQKRPAAPFQRQEKKKAMHQSPQRPTALGSHQLSSQHFPCGKKECPHCGRAHGGFSREHSVEGHQPQQQQQRQRQDDQRDLEPQLELCIEDRVLEGCFFLLKMKDYDAILGLDWLEEHYASGICTIFHFGRIHENAADLPVAIQVATGRSGATRGLAGLARSGLNRGALGRRVLNATPSAGATPLISRRIAPARY